MSHDLLRMDCTFNVPNRGALVVLIQLTLLVKSVPVLISNLMSAL